MKFMIPFLISILPVASIAQSPSGVASGVPSVAIPKTTEVLVIQTPKQGKTAQQILAVIPAEIRATVKLYPGGKIRQWLASCCSRMVHSLSRSAGPVGSNKRIRSTIKFSPTLSPAAIG